MFLFRRIRYNRLVGRVRSGLSNSPFSSFIRVLIITNSISENKDKINALIIKQSQYRSEGNKNAVTQVSVINENKELNIDILKE